MLSVNKKKKKRQHSSHFCIWQRKLSWLSCLKNMLAFFLTNTRNSVAWRVPEFPKECSFLWNATIIVHVQICPRFWYLKVQNLHRFLAAKCPENCMHWSCFKLWMNRIFLRLWIKSSLLGCKAGCICSATPLLDPHSLREAKWF